MEGLRSIRRPSEIFNPNLVKSPLLITYHSFTQSLWNCSQSTIMILSCSVQNFETIGELEQMLWTSEFWWDLSLRSVSVSLNVCSQGNSGTHITIYPMLRADSRFWLVNNREIWSRISRLTSSAWDIKTKERHWWRHNGDSDRRPLSLPLRYNLVTLCLYDDLGQINVIAWILKLRKRFRMSQILFEHELNSWPLVCFRGYGNLSTLSIAIPRLAFGRAWYCDAACG